MGGDMKSINIGFYSEGGHLMWVSENLRNGLADVCDVMSGDHIWWDSLPRGAVWLSEKYESKEVQNFMAGICA